MAGRLQDKVALITGGCSGIGLGTVELFVAEGARVVLADFDVERGRRLEAASAGRLRFAACDVREEPQIAAAVALAVSAFGRLDILFNNAGGTGASESIEAMPVAAWDETMGFLLRAPMLGIKHAVPVMKAGGGGSIINTSSVAGLRPGIAGTAYSVAKAGINQLTRVAAMEYAPFHIRVNAICPGVILTPAIGTSFGATRAQAEQLLPRVAQVADHLQPIPRAGQPRDIAEACLYLGSDAAAFVTGTELVVDGGLTQLPPDGYRSTVEAIIQVCSRP